MRFPDNTEEGVKARLFRTNEAKQNAARRKREAALTGDAEEALAVAQGWDALTQGDGWRDK